MSNFDSIDEALNVESEIVRTPKKHDLVNVSDNEELSSDAKTMTDKKKDYE